MIELYARYNEVDHRVRPDNPREVVLLKVQRDRLIRSLGKEAARRHPTVRMFNDLIQDWYNSQR